jgi:ribulose-phosphate 3-epimerase
MCGNLLYLEHDIRILVEGGADLLHVDMMDGHFVKNYGLCYDLVRQVRRITQIPLDLHLAMNEPEGHVRLCKDAGASFVTFHPEATRDPHGLADAIHAEGMRVCIAISPKLPLREVETLFDHADMVNVLTVNPGFAGQKLIPSTLNKLAALTQKIGQKNRTIPISVDGNVSYENIPKMIELGANVLVLGTSSLFRSDCPLRQSLSELMQFFHQHGYRNLQGIKS